MILPINLDVRGRVVERDGNTMGYFPVVEWKLFIILYDAAAGNLGCWKGRINLRG